MDWKEYENDVYNECLRVFDNSEIIKNAHIKGKYSLRSRQIDVLINNETLGKIVIDAKNYEKKIDVKTVESFIGMIKDIEGDKGIIVSEKGFSKSAINRAHLGEINIEVDILSLNELDTLHSTEAMPYSGSNSIIMRAPFGWIIDGKQYGFAPATIYPRGLSFEEALKNKEWSYIQIYTKDNNINSVQQLLYSQNQNIIKADLHAKIEQKLIDNIYIRKARIKNYPTMEITCYKEFKRFILFIVLYCPNNLIERDIQKLIYLLKSAIPGRVIQ
jgi:hypothetical protein